MYVLVDPHLLFVLSFAIIKETNENWSRTRIYRMRVWLSAPKKTAPKPSSSDDAQEQGQADSAAAAADGAQQDASQEVLVTQIPEPNNPYTKKISMHLHHWQIFYMLAYFTRFTHPVSQVGAGIVLACYMEGICAYGYDQLLND